MPLPFTDLLQSIAERFNRSERTPAPKLATAAEIGSYGERVAAAFLIHQGYRILTRNYRTEHGEIDLICRLGEKLIFVEVRTRGSIDFGHPVETIKTAKQEALRFAARRYLELLDRDDVYHRFDAVDIILVEGKVPVCTLFCNLFV